MQGQEVVVWLAARFAEKWFSDAMREASSAGPDARRREVVFAVCFAESYLVEWVRIDALKGQNIDRVADYFPLADRNLGIDERWKKVPKNLRAEGVIAGCPDYERSACWPDFLLLLKYRNGLVHGRASRPDTEGLDERIRPLPAPGDLNTLPQGWPTRVVVALVRELHASAGTRPPEWLVDP